MDKPTILYFSPFDGPLSGADRDLIHLINALPEHYRLRIVCRDHPEDLRSHLRPGVECEIARVPYPLYPYMLPELQDRKVNLLRFARYMRWFLRENLHALARVNDFVGHFSVDIVHTWVSTIALGAMYATKNRKKHVWHTREALHTRRYPQRLWLSIMNLAASAIVAPTMLTAGSYGSKSVAIGDGAPVSELLSSYRATRSEPLQEELGIRGERVLCQVGTLDRHKGHLVFVEAVGQLLKRKPHLRIRVFILGREVNHDYMTEIMALIRRLALEESVHVLGYRCDYLAFLKLADIIVHPSTLSDAYPNVVRDALLFGKPVIASRCGGIPDMIDDGVSGLLVTPGDVRELSERIELLLDTPALGASLGERARLSAARRFDVRQTAQQMDALYQSLLG